MWSLFLERVTPAHDQPCMIWQSMPTEQVMTGSSSRLIVTFWGLQPK